MRDPDHRPDRLVVRYVFLEIADHGLRRLVVEWDVVRVHAENLLPVVAAGELEVHVHVGKGLINLRVNLAVEPPGRKISSAYSFLVG